MGIEEFYNKTFYVTNKMTANLEHAIKRINTLEEFEKAFPDEFLKDDDRVGNYLQELLFKYDKTASGVSEKANIHRSYVGNIINGKKKDPSRDILLAICLAIGTTLDEAQYLLKYAGKAPLYVRRKRDVIIWFGFMKQKSVTDVNLDLYNRKYKTLT